MLFTFFFFKQKTAYEMRISDWSSDVCSSDLLQRLALVAGFRGLAFQLVDARQSAFDFSEGVYHHATIRVRSLVPSGLGRARSEERRVGQECVSTCRPWWSPNPLNKKQYKLRTIAYHAN